MIDEMYAVIARRSDGAMPSAVKMAGGWQGAMHLFYEKPQAFSLKQKLNEAEGRDVYGVFILHIEVKEEINKK